MRDYRQLDFSGAALYSANVSGQSALSGTADMGKALVASLTLFYVWAVLTPLVLWLGRRFLFERHLLRNLLIHLLLCGPVALLHIWLLQNVNVLSRNYRDKFFAVLG